MSATAAQPGAVAKRRRPGRTIGAPALFASGFVLLCAVTAVNVTMGAAGLGLGDVLGAVFAPTGAEGEAIVREVRLPRVTAGLLVGAALGVSGALFQSVTRNPFGSPDILGVNAGAFLAIVATTVFVPSLLGLPGMAIAFVGGLLTALLVYGVSASLRPTPLRLALAGVAVALMLAAAAGALQLLYQVETAGLFFWGQGALVQDGWSDVALALPVIGVGLVAALAMGRPLDVLALGEDSARALGQRVGSVRLAGWVVAVLLASVAVSVTGPIGFAGLMAPHIARLLGLRRAWALLPGSAMWGALIVVGSDNLARLFGSNLQEVPAGVVTAVLGLPFLVWLARRSSGGELDATPASDASRTGVAASPRRYAATIGIAGLLLLLALAAGLLLGELPISELTTFVVMELRLPRLLVALVAGAALAVSGVILQGVLRNPLAEPLLVGIMPGATIGALTVLIVFPTLPVELLPLAAFAGGVITFAAVYALSWRKGGVAATRLALVGIGFAAAGTGIVSLIVIEAELLIAQALVWLTGSTYAREWGDLTRLLPWAVVLLPLAWLGGRQLDLFALGDTAVRALGVRLERTRIALLALAVGLASAAVAVVGAVGFVGLVAPHVARLTGAGRGRRAVPLAALIGAMLVVASDAIGRTVLAPKEIPAGIVTAVIGTPFFVWLLWRTRR